MPHRALLRDPRVGQSTPVTMALVMRLVAALRERPDLEPIARGALDLIELAAFDAFTASIGEGLAGSRSTAESEQRLRELVELTGKDFEIVVEGRNVTHAPLPSSAATLRQPERTATQLGDALYHLQWLTRRLHPELALTNGFIMTQVYLRLERLSVALPDRAEDRALFARAVAESLILDLGDVPDASDMERCLDAIARDHGKWEALADVLSLDGDSAAETLHKQVQRWRPKLERSRREGPEDEGAPVEDEGQGTPVG